MGTAVLRLNAYALCRMIFPLDGAKAVSLAFEDGEGGMPVLVATIEASSVPDTDDLNPVYRELCGLRTACGRAARAYILHRIDGAGAANQGARNSSEDSGDFQSCNLPEEPTP